MKKVNDALVKQLSSVERQCRKNAQYSRRECVEVVGISSLVEHDQLEPTVCRILHHIGVNISEDKIEACHRLGKNSDRIIVKFSSRKDCQHTMRVKEDLKDLDATDLDLPAGTKLYINESLCPYYRGFIQSKILKNDQLEPTVCRILHHIGVNISEDKIEACHRLGKNSDRIIVKFSSRKDCQHTMRVKEDLKDLDATDLDLPAGTKLYINESLCPYYRGL